MTWLHWGRRLQAVAQSGLAYQSEPYHAERYREVAGIAEAILAASTGATAADVAALFSAEVGHATPKLDVRGATFDDERVLLVQERVTGRWTLPGGWAEIGQGPAESAVREVREESGYAVRATKLIALHDRERRGYRPHPWYSHKATFLCELVDAERAAPDHEVLDVGFFAKDALPPLDDNRTSPDLIATCFAHARDVSLPTEFD